MSERENDSKMTGLEIDLCAMGLDGDLREFLAAYSFVNEDSFRERYPYVYGVLEVIRGTARAEINEDRVPFFFTDLNIANLGDYLTLLDSNDTKAVEYYMRGKGILGALGLCHNCYA